MPATQAIRKRRQAYRQAVEVDVISIRYTQPSVKDTFTNGAPLSWTIHMLKTAQIKPRELPLIRIGCINKVYRTIDNRRLYCFKASGIKRIPVIVMQNISLEFEYKNQSSNDGLTIQLIHNTWPPNTIDHNQLVMAYDPKTSQCKRWKIDTIIQQTKELKLMQSQEFQINGVNHESLNKLQIRKDVKHDNDMKQSKYLMHNYTNVDIHENIKTDIFSVLDQLQHKYSNHKDLFLDAIEQYAKQCKK
eukprot:505856_1